MKKILLTFLLAGCFAAVHAQDSVRATVTEPLKENKAARKKYTKADLSGRAADHFMLQLGYLSWAGVPDSVRTTGLPRTFNFYLMLDFPFASNPRFSAAIGAGIGSDNMYFEDTRIPLNSSDVLNFVRDTLVQYKKYKLTTAYLEAPVELRWANRPDDMNRSVKVALGVKVGTLVNAYTKAVVDRDEDGFGGYKVKTKDNRFFNGTRLAATARIGYGNFSLFGQYYITQFIKEGLGPEIRPFSIGLSISGL